MTVTTDKPPAEPWFQLDITGHERLQQLEAMELQARADAKAAADRWSTVKAAIETELVMAAPGHNRILLINGQQPLRLEARTIRKLDTKALAEKEPEIYERFRKTSTSWYLTR
jgi:hypothetical protein